MTWLRWNLDNLDLLVGAVRAENIRVGPSPEPLREQVRRAVQQAQSSDGPESVRKAIRDLLRHGGFKPSGRNKPASEFLLRSARRGTWPEINAVVDVNNLVSLQTGWPCSVVDLDKVADAPQLRLGHQGEKFVFNRTGQTIDVSKLICVADSEGAFANPVKDSMRTKVGDETRSVAMFLFTSRVCATRDEILKWSRRVAGLLEQFAGATDVSVDMFGAT